ncbi:MAG: DNA methyltransferase, partial [Enterococcus hulanensis]
MSQDSLFEEEGTVECLGLTFNNDDERREYFRDELRKKLPELKKIDGFPIGEDEDIIALSDPPYYTACPNPWMSEYISLYGNHRETSLVKEPLSVDIAEGKNDAIYNAHSYHTKVPYKAIMRYLLYYTQVNDVVLDGFCGSGMTGVASEMCQDRNIVKEILGEKFDDNLVGKRNAINIDLSPAGTFISHNYNKKKNELGEKNLEVLLSKLREEYEWCFSTLISPEDKIENLVDVSNFYKENKQRFGEINYIVWSEQYICPTCSNTFSFWKGCVSEDEKVVAKELTCPFCNSKHEKRKLTLKNKLVYDSIVGKNMIVPDLIPIKINYSVNKKRFNKIPDWYDKEVINYFDIYKGEKNIPIKEFDVDLGNEIRRPIKLGYEFVHQIYTNRILSVLDFYITNSQKSVDEIQFLLGSTLPKLTRMNRFMPQHGSRALVGPMANALYFPPLSVENNAISQFEFQAKKIIKAWSSYDGTLISTQSSTSLDIPESSVDYIFVDPPFGANIMYSELNFIREAWLSVYTNNEKEAIENKALGKDILKYTDLMGESFKEFYRVLKPQKWITVEFSNTSAKVWNALQHVIQSAGFVIASVDALDKKRGGFHSMITTTAVKQDLVISAYKPGTSESKSIQSGLEGSMWNFVSQHLEKLTVFNGTRGNAAVNVERKPRIIFDRMVAYYVQLGIPVPLSSAEFQKEIAQKYIMRDGMVFLESQVAEYDKKRVLAKDFADQVLFV